MSIRRQLAWQKRWLREFAKRPLHCPENHIAQERAVLGLKEILIARLELATDHGWNCKCAGCSTLRDWYEVLRLFGSVLESETSTSRAMVEGEVRFLEARQRYDDSPVDGGPVDDDDEDDNEDQGDDEEQACEVQPAAVADNPFYGGDSGR